MEAEHFGTQQKIFYLQDDFVQQKLQNPTSTQLKRKVTNTKKLFIKRDEEYKPPSRCSQVALEESYEQSRSPSPAAETGTSCWLECQGRQQAAQPANPPFTH